MPRVRSELCFLSKQAAQPVSLLVSSHQLFHQWQTVFPSGTRLGSVFWETHYVWTSRAVSRTPAISRGSDARLNGAQIKTKENRRLISIGAEGAREASEGAMRNPGPLLSRAHDSSASRRPGAVRFVPSRSCAGSGDGSGKGFPVTDRGHLAHLRIERTMRAGQRLPAA